MKFARVGLVCQHEVFKVFIRGEPQDFLRSEQSNKHNSIKNKQTNKKKIEIGKLEIKEIKMMGI